MRTIDADDFEECLKGAEAMSRRMGRMHCASVWKSVRDLLRNFPTSEPPTACDGCKYEVLTLANSPMCQRCRRRFTDNYEPVAPEEGWDYA